MIYNQQEVSRQWINYFEIMGTKGDSVIISGVLRYDEIYVIITFRFSWCRRLRNFEKTYRSIKQVDFINCWRISRRSRMIDHSTLVEQSLEELAVFTKFKEYLKKERKKEERYIGSTCPKNSNWWLLLYHSSLLSKF